MSYGPPPGPPGPPGYNQGYNQGYGQGYAPPAQTQPGFAYRGQAGPPPGTDPQLWAMFESVDTDRSGHISATELQRALMNGDWSPFDLDTVKLLMTIFDTDRSGTIGFKEFAGLWKYINDWQNIFKTFDRDRSGTIEGNELGQALSQFGYNLSNELLMLLEKKYAVPTGHGHAPAGISFDRFLRACVGVKQLTDTFNQHDTARNGWIQLNYEMFLKIVLSAP